MKLRTFVGKDIQIWVGPHLIRGHLLDITPNELYLTQVSFRSEITPPGHRIGDQNYMLSPTDWWIPLDRVDAYRLCSWEQPEGHPSLD